VGRVILCAALCAVTVHARPGGPVVARYDGRTEFGSPLVLAVGARRGRWVGVFTPDVPNGRLGWVRADGVRVERVAAHVVVSLSQRRLTLYRGDRAVHSFTVGIGAPGTATPTGEFAVTDKLPGSRFSPVYGCCILALSGHQTHLPSGWRGGDRLAIHGGPFAAVSTGCVHASTAALEFLMAHVPLGTRVTIRA